MLTATWSLASLASLAGVGVASVALHEAAGWGGLVAARHDALPPLPGRAGHVLAVGRVVAAVTEPRDAVVCATRAPDRLSVLALRHAGGTRVLMASRDREPRDVVVELPFAVDGIVAAVLSTTAAAGWLPVDVARAGPRRASVTIPARGVIRLDLD
jgi:hypothetical protein